MATLRYRVNTQISHASASIELTVSDLDRENGFAAEGSVLQLRVDVRGVRERSDGPVAQFQVAVGQLCHCFGQRRRDLGRDRSGESGAELLGTRIGERNDALGTAGQ